MTDRTTRALTLALLASTAFVTPAFAQDAPAAPTPEEAAQAAETAKVAAAPADEDSNVRWWSGQDLRPFNGWGRRLGLRRWDRPPGLSDDAQSLLQILPTP